MACVVLLGASPDPNTITSNKQQFCFNHQSNASVMNAHAPISSRRYERGANAVNMHMIMLISLYYLFSFVFIADSRILGVGDTLRVCRRSALRALERRQRRHGFRSGLKPSQFCLGLSHQTSLHKKQRKCAPH